MSFECNVYKSHSGAGTTCDHQLLRVTLIVTNGKSVEPSLYFQNSGYYYYYYCQVVLLSASPQFLFNSYYIFPLKDLLGTLLICNHIRYPQPYMWQCFLLFSRFYSLPRSLNAYHKHFLYYSFVIIIVSLLFRAFVYFERVLNNAYSLNYVDR